MKKNITILLLLTAIILPCHSQNFGQYYREQYGKQDKEQARQLGKALGDAWGNGLGQYYDAEFKYLALSLGYGRSYGGAGGKVMVRFSESFCAIGLSAGLGVTPSFDNTIERVSNRVFFSAGAQMYIENFYIDWQVGHMKRLKYAGKEKNQVGMTLLCGYNWFFWDNLGCNAALGFGGPIPWNAEDEKNIKKEYFDKPDFIVEFGICYRFPFK
ncbi:MAG: hypothetical protein LBN27_03305 [Prevotellaceae bacterium]|nr:hypothetical protein [Prevotellaceae bacterium]